MQLRSRFRSLAVVGLGVVAMLGVAVAPSSAGQAPAVADARRTTPTVVLVHGAFADASGWDRVIGILQRDGYPVLAVANPLRGLAADSAYLRSILDTVPGPVVLVGHSYGGSLITNAATGAANVKALVYVAAFAPDRGETLNQFSDPTRYPGSKLTPEALVVRPYPGGAEASIDPVRFREIFAADLPRSETTRMAARQRPVSVASFDEAHDEPAWRTIPSWYLVFGQDRALSPVAQRFFAQRAGADTVEVRASHAGFISHADRTGKLIESAARAVR
ncbi:alpha/beta fold hydrolase [Plantactinospora sp. WMMB334]|uniref:alpha/beta fold hydrolase n=1 Tax=Plantactinospora sp. WMMB334 TaxID=3404119 RepID=UPI003B95EA69